MHALHKTWSRTSSETASEEKKRFSNNHSTTNNLKKKKKRNQIFKIKRDREREPEREPILESLPKDEIPTKWLSKNPIKTEPQFSRKQSNPDESNPEFIVLWKMIYSIKPYRTNSPKHSQCK